MSDLDERIAFLEKQLAEALRLLRDRLREIFTEAERQYLEVFAEHEREIARITVKIVRQKMLSAITEDEILDAMYGTRGRRRGEPNASEGRMSAKEVILRALLERSLHESERTLHATELDAAVIREGWTKAASEKAKSLLRGSGFVVAARRRWAITNAGKRALLSGSFSAPALRPDEHPGGEQAPVVPPTPDTDAVSASGG